MKEYRIDYYNELEWISTTWKNFRTRSQAERFAISEIEKVAEANEVNKNNIMYEVR